MAKQDALRSFSEGGLGRIGIDPTAKQDVLRSFSEEGLESVDHAGRRYVGTAGDLRTRLREHNRGKSRHSAKFAPWRLVTYVAFSDRAKADAFEADLKSGSGHAFARKRLWGAYRSIWRWRP